MPRNGGSTPLPEEVQATNGGRSLFTRNFSFEALVVQRQRRLGKQDPLRRWLLLGLLLVGTIQTAGAASIAPSILLSAGAVHNLSASVAQGGREVHLRASVTYFDKMVDPRRGALFVEDATGGVFVAFDHAMAAQLPASLPAGTLVDVTGKTAPGDFASIVGNAHIRVLARARPTVRYRSVGMAELLTGLDDCRSVAITGVVLSTIYSETNVTLNIEMAGGVVGATTKRVPGVNFEQLVDAKVTIQGVAAPLFNHDRQLTGARLYFQDASQVIVRSPAPGDPYDAPLHAIGELSRFDPVAKVQQRAHVRGVVTLNWPGSLICLQDDKRGVCAPSPEAAALQVGEIADVVGFVKLGSYRPTLQYAKVKGSGVLRELPPMIVSAADALHGTYDSELVQIDGKLLGRDVLGEKSILMLSVGNTVFSAVLPTPPRENALKRIPIGSTLRLRGICSVQIDDQGTLQGQGFSVTKSFRIKAQSIDDVLVLTTPSPWTVARIVWLLIVLASVTLLILGWVYVLRKRVEQQTKVIRESEERFRFLAQHDALTSLPTRTLLCDSLSNALTDARQSKAHLSLLMLDLDNFKQINDTFGHQVGDEALRITASRLMNAVRPVDLVARMSGDEFMILLRDLGDETQAEQIASGILDSFAHQFILKDQAIPVSVSIGVFHIADPCSDCDAILKNVDTAMYSAKTKGKNQIQVFSPEMEFTSTRKNRVRLHLARALEHDEFTLKYQPLVEFGSGMVTGFEVLLRWHSSVLGPVSPSEFIPVAEESNLIVRIGEWVLDRAVSEIARLQSYLNRAFSLAVNLSPREFLHEELAAKVRTTLERYNFDPHLLKLEITERTLMSYAPNVQLTLNEIRALGVQLAIDDFGVGFSCLSYITRLPVDWIKVDRSLVSDCCSDQKSAAVLRAIVAMAHGVEIQVVAEGIENAEQYAFLEEEGCDVAQGFWLSRPVGVELLPHTICRMEADDPEAVPAHSGSLAPLRQALG